jgi:hypothetical protein
MVFAAIIKSQHSVVGTGVNVYLKTIALTY